MNKNKFISSFFNISEKDEQELFKKVYLKKPCLKCDCFYCICKEV